MLRTDIQVASALPEAVNNAVSMLDKITRAMPRFEKYMQLYPETETLQEALLTIYSRYMDFCMNTAELFSCTITGERPFQQVAGLEVSNRAPKAPGYL